MAQEIVPAKETKCLIIGSGPAGLTAAIYASRANLKPIVAGGTITAGGQLMLTTEIENFPGFPEGIAGPKLMENMFKQAKRFGAEIIEEEVSEMKLKAGGPHLVKVGDQWIKCASVIIAVGAAARWLKAPGEEKFVNRGISACATCDGALPVFRNKHIMVVGGGDTAIEEATFLTKFASQVTIIHRRDQFRASKAMADRALHHPKIKVAWNSEIVGYKGEKRLEKVLLKNSKTNETAEIDAAGVFMAIGHEPNTKFLKGSGVELLPSGYVKARDFVRTNIEGVFTAGDCHDAYFRQAVSAAGFGCMSALACERWLEEKESA